MSRSRGGKGGLSENLFVQQRRRPESLRRLGPRALARSPGGLGRRLRAFLRPIASAPPARLSIALGRGAFSHLPV